MKWRDLAEAQRSQQGGDGRVSGCRLNFVIVSIPEASFEAVLLADLIFEVLMKVKQFVCLDERVQVRTCL